ncbi:hypothetical protein ACS0TY_036507 [Phlomoides rotata]
MGSKVIIMLGLFLAMVVLISTQVSARDLAETSNTIDASTDGGGHGGHGGHGGGGGHGGHGGGGGGGGHGGGGGGGGHGGGGGGCRYGRCCGHHGCRCCSYAGEKSELQN